MRREWGYEVFREIEKRPSSFSFGMKIFDIDSKPLWTSVKCSAHQQRSWCPIDTQGLGLLVIIAVGVPCTGIWWRLIFNWRLGLPWYHVYIWSSEPRYIIGFEMLREASWLIHSYIISGGWPVTMSHFLLNNFFPKVHQKQIEPIDRMTLSLRYIKKDLNKWRHIANLPCQSISWAWLGWSTRKQA